MRFAPGASLQLVGESLGAREFPHVRAVLGIMVRETSGNTAGIV